ncbi:MAG: cellulase family glycosylhydrolase [Bryobacteraceae bacterium]
MAHLGKPAATPFQSRDREGAIGGASDSPNRSIGGRRIACPTFALAILCAASLHAQTATFNPLQVAADGSILDSTGKPVLLRGLNRSGTGSGNADAISTDQDYAAQNQLLSMNLVRIFVNATWWTTNVQVPIASMPYQTYIDTLIQRAKKYGNYVLILKAGQFPEPPCGASGTNCPAPNQGDLDCAATPSLCPAESTSGADIDVALAFWDAFAQKYAADPAVLYDTWENMSGLDPGTWSDDQDQLIATIRTYNPQALIFVEDTGTAFESITAGTTPDLAWSNIVWNFHIYNASSGTCTEPASPRYANWSQNFDALVSYAQQNGHGVAITEWGGCNDSEPYNTNITSYAKTHSIALCYFDNTNLIALSGSTDQLTATGTKVAQAYTAIAAGTSTAAPAITLVANAEGDVPAIAPNTWVEIKGTNLAPAGDTRIWLGSDFFGNQMPEQLDGVSATVNGKGAYVYYISPTQVNILTPPEAMLGPVTVQLTVAGVAGAPATVKAQAVAPSFFVFNGGPYVVAEHTNGSLLGPTTLYPGSSTPAKPGETVVLFANGFGPTSTPVVDGSVTQGGTLSPLPVVTIGGATANVVFAGLVAVGEFQFNVVVPASLANGDQPITATYNGLTTQPGTLITVHN